MTDPLEGIEAQLGSQRDFDSPPLDQWHPELSGDIPIVIRADGSWFHDGGRVRRASLVRLFASILRREADGEYYLVTPVEKWRLQVELHALIVTDVASLDGRLQLTLNTGRQLTVSADHPLFLEPARDDVAAVMLWHGLTALFNRNAWYRLVELADAAAVVRSGDYAFNLGTGQGNA